MEECTLKNVLNILITVILTASNRAECVIELKMLASLSLTKMQARIPIS